MISVRHVVYNKDGKVSNSLELRQYDSDLILVRDDEEDIYPILSEITTFDIERYYPEHMDSLIKELTTLKKTLAKKSQKDYIDEVISLCQRCLDRNEGEIVFNPFTNIIRIGSKEKN